MMMQERLGRYLHEKQGEIRYLDMKEKNPNRIIKLCVMIGLLLITLVMGVYTVHVAYHKIEDPSGVDACFILHCIAYILLFVLLTFVSRQALFGKKYKDSLEKLFLPMIVVLGFLYLLIIPIMVVPDEYVHIYTAYDMSDVMMGTHDAETVIMRQVDEEHIYNPIKITKEDYNSQYEGVFQRPENTNLIKTAHISEQTPRYLYILSGMGITIGRLLGTSTTMLYLLGRLMNFLAFIAATYYAIKRIPFGKGIVMVWALLPITLQQACSISYDSPVFALSILVTATTMSAAYGEETNRKARLVNNIVMILSCLLLLPCKGFSLLPLVVLPLMLIPGVLRQHKDKVDAIKQKMKPWMKVLIFAVAGIAVFACAAVLVLVVRRWLQPENINNTYIAWSDSPGYTIGYFLKNPIRLLEIMINTLWYESGSYIQQMLGSYLGWLEIQVPLVFVMGFFLLFFYVSMRKENERQLIKTGDRIWMILVFVGVSSLAVAAMLLYWTPNALVMVAGLQGRYFLPVLVVGFLAVRTKRTCVSENADQYAAMWTVFLQMHAITAIFWTVDNV